MQNQGNIMVFHCCSYEVVLYQQGIGLPSPVLNRPKILWTAHARIELMLSLQRLCPLSELFYVHSTWGHIFCYFLCRVAFWGVDFLWGDSRAEVKVTELLKLIRIVVPILDFLRYFILLVGNAKVLEAGNKNIQNQTLIEPFWARKPANDGRREGLEPFYVRKIPRPLFPFTVQMSSSLWIAVTVAWGERERALNKSL